MRKKKCECNVCTGLPQEVFPRGPVEDADFWRRVQEQIRTFNQAQRNHALNNTILQGVFTDNIETPNHP